MITNKSYKNHFIEISSIGSGAFSTVFKSRCIRDETLYAIKKVPIKNEQQEVIIKELRFLSKLDSSYIVKYIDSWIEPNYYDSLSNDENADKSSKALNQRLLNLRIYPQLLHIQMELCSLTLRDAMKIIAKECKTPYNNLTLIGYYISSELMYEILECVQYLHSQNPAIIHRDLKPENILLTYFAGNRFVRLSDFGFEVNATRKYTPKVDIYSLGIIMQELFHIDCTEMDSIYEPELESKMNFVIQLVQNLLSFVPNNRKNCDQVMSEYRSWFLSEEQLLNDDEFKQLLICSNSNLMDENFIHYFVQNKYPIHKSLYATIHTHVSKFKKNFTEICPLGRTIFSTVFKCENKFDNKLYAIKKVCFSAEKEDSVMKELKLLSHLRSDYVIQYIDSWIESNYYIGSIRGEAYGSNSRNLLYSHKYPQLLHIQMELFSFSLRDAINCINKDCVTSDKLSLIGYYIASELLVEILECVEYLHKYNPAIIHRDLKPENILLSNFDNNRFVKLSDFGLSTFHEFNDQSHTKYIGTRSYKAPELNFSRKYDTKADIYSLGIIMQELFHIDFNDEKIEKFTPLNIIKELDISLLNPIPRMRPDCSQILSQQTSYRINHNELTKNEDIIRIVSNNSKSMNIGDNFVEYFVQKKFKNTILKF